MTNAEVEALIGRLVAQPKFGNGIGLHRMKWLVQNLPDPSWLAAQDAIKVTGSNGKGSVTTMIASIMGKLGLSNGAYTSPHLLQFNERIMLNGQPISDEALSDAFNWVDRQKTRYARHYSMDTIGAFEVFTAIAAYHFSMIKPNIIVAEAGIGGRYDSTRVLPGKLVGLASIDLEHTQLLGNTHEQIAYDKADLCPAGGMLVAGTLGPELIRRLEAYCGFRDVQLLPIESVTRVETVTYTSTEMVVSMNVGEFAFENLKLSLQGPHQVENAAVAIMLAWEWLKTHHPEISKASFQQAVYQGMPDVVWAGRFQHIHDAPHVYMDVGHTPAAMENVVKTAQKVIQQPILLVTGGSTKKSIETMIPEIDSPRQWNHMHTSIPPWRSC
jgi:dihydrofolate synthase/folylpolyglutamate synthase